MPSSSIPTALRKGRSWSRIATFGLVRCRRHRWVLPKVNGPAKTPWIPKQGSTVNAASSLSALATSTAGTNPPRSATSLLNLKENITAEITHCVFQDNEIALRVRGPGERGGAHVSITDCAIYDTQVGVRAEDKIEKLKISGLAFSERVTDRIKFVNGKATPGYENTGERDALPIKLLLTKGFPSR